jgi:hypothetical protein
MVTVHTGGKAKSCLLQLQVSHEGRESQGAVARARKLTDISPPAYLIHD